MIPNVWRGEIQTAEKALALVKERFPNVKAAAIKADVGKEADVKGAVDKAVELFGRLDIMVRPVFEVDPTFSNPFRSCILRLLCLL